MILRLTFLVTVAIARDRLSSRERNILIEYTLGGHKVMRMNKYMREEGKGKPGPNTAQFYNAVANAMSKIPADTTRIKDVCGRLAMCWIAFRKN